MTSQDLFGSHDADPFHDDVDDPLISQQSNRPAFNAFSLTEQQDPRSSATHQRGTVVDNAMYMLNEMSAAVGDVDNDMADLLSPDLLEQETLPLQTGPSDADKENGLAKQVLQSHNAPMQVASDKSINTADLASQFSLHLDSTSQEQSVPLEDSSSATRTECLQTPSRQARQQQQHKQPVHAVGEQHLGERQCEDAFPAPVNVFRALAKKLPPPRACSANQQTATPARSALQQQPSSNPLHAAEPRASPKRTVSWVQDVVTEVHAVPTTEKPETAMEQHTLLPERAPPAVHTARNDASGKMSPLKANHHHSQQDLPQEAPRPSVAYPPFQYHGSQEDSFVMNIGPDSFDVDEVDEVDGGDGCSERHNDKDSSLDSKQGSVPDSGKGTGSAHALVHDRSDTPRVVFRSAVNENIEMELVDDNDNEEDDDSHDSNGDNADLQHDKDRDTDQGCNGENGLSKLSEARIRRGDAVEVTQQRGGQQQAHQHADTTDETSRNCGEELDDPRDGEDEDIDEDEIADSDDLEDNISADPQKSFMQISVHSPPRRPSYAARVHQSSSPDGIEASPQLPMQALPYQHRRAKHNAPLKKVLPPTLPAKSDGDLQKQGTTVTEPVVVGLTDSPHVDTADGSQTQDANSHPSEKSISMHTNTPTQPRMQPLPVVPSAEHGPATPQIQPTQPRTASRRHRATAASLQKGKDLLLVNQKGEEGDMQMSCEQGPAMRWYKKAYVVETVVTTHTKVITTTTTSSDGIPRITTTQVPLKTQRSRVIRDIQYIPLFRAASQLPLQFSKAKARGRVEATPACTTDVGPSAKETKVNRIVASSVHRGPKSVRKTAAAARQLQQTSTASHSHPLPASPASPATPKPTAPSPDSVSATGVTTKRSPLPSFPRPSPPNPASVRRGRRASLKSLTHSLPFTKRLQAVQPPSPMRSPAVSTPHRQQPSPTTSTDTKHRVPKAGRCEETPLSIAQSHEKAAVTAKRSLGIYAAEHDDRALSRGEESQSLLQQSTLHSDTLEESDEERFCTPPSSAMHADARAMGQPTAAEFASALPRAEGEGAASEEPQPQLLRFANHPSPAEWKKRLPTETRIYAQFSKNDDFFYPGKLAGFSKNAFRVHFDDNTRAAVRQVIVNFTFRPGMLVSVAQSMQSYISGTVSEVKSAGVVVKLGAHSKKVFGLGEVALPPETVADIVLAQSSPKKRPPASMHIDDASGLLASMTVAEIEHQREMLGTFSSGEGVPVLRRTRSSLRRRASSNGKNGSSTRKTAAPSVDDSDPNQGDNNSKSSSSSNDPQPNRTGKRRASARGGVGHKALHSASFDNSSRGNPLFDGDTNTLEDADDASIPDSNSARSPKSAAVWNEMSDSIQSAKRAKRGSTVLPLTGYHVSTTGAPKEISERKLGQLVKQLGGVFLPRAADLASAEVNSLNCILLGTGAKTTKKYLLALAKSIACVHVQWLTQVGKSGTFLPFDDYLLPRGTSQAVHKPLGSTQDNRSSSWAWETDRALTVMPTFKQTRFLAGKSVFIAASDPGTISFWKAVILSVGGSVIDRKKFSRAFSNSFRFDDDADDGFSCQYVLVKDAADEPTQATQAILQQAKAVGIPAVTHAWLIQSLIHAGEVPISLSPTFVA